MACSTSSCVAIDKKENSNVFIEPHQRMKQLVEWPLKEAAKVSDVHDLEPSLQAIYEAMWEMKSHEYIENHYIMDRLKQRLQTNQVYNELVCNCHEDSKLLDVISLVEKVYQANTQRDRVKYGRRLQKSIKGFMEEFLEHMAEEESVFQPLLDQNFDTNELKQMKEVVERQHSMFREKVKSEKSLKALKRKRPTGEKSGNNELELSMDDLRFRKSYCQEVNDFLKNNREEDEDDKKSPIVPSSLAENNKQTAEIVNKWNEDDDDIEILAKKSKTNDDVGNGSIEPVENKPLPLVVCLDQSKKKKIHSKICVIEDLPEEILIFIFSHLNPCDLVACGAVNRLWKNLAFSSVFWKALYPTQWGRGQWSFDYIQPDLKSEDDIMASWSNLSSVSSSMASSLESLEADGTVSETSLNVTSSIIPGSGKKKEDKIFDGIAIYLLPKVGASVSTLILSVSKTLSDQQVNVILAQVPNVRTVNLSYTCITSEAFDGLYKHNALRKLEDLQLQGCARISDNILGHLSRCFSSQKKRPSSRSKLRKLSLAGCRSLTSVALEYLVVHAVALQELDLSGCYKIDGETLCLFVDRCPRLKPERLAYCNDIEDGPYPDSANGCLNLDCEIRFCCQKMRN